MNKFIVLIAGLVAFAAVAQFAHAQTQTALGQTSGLVNEIPEDEDIDDELEGGLTRDPVGVRVEDEWGRDILDEDKGQSKFNQERTQNCKKAKNALQCQTCCNDDNKAYRFERLSNIFRSGCTCYERFNSYTKII